MIDISAAIYGQVSVDRRLLLFNADGPHGPKYRSYQRAYPTVLNYPYVGKQHDVTPHIPLLGQYVGFRISVFIFFFFFFFPHLRHGSQDSLKLSKISYVCIVNNISSLRLLSSNLNCNAEFFH